MTNSACCRVPMTRTQRKSTKRLGQKYSPMPIAPARTRKSWRTARLARQTERRVSLATTSLGNALRKSSLNSSPFTAKFYLQYLSDNLRRSHAKGFARCVVVRGHVGVCPVSESPGAADRAVGRGRRHRRDGADHRGAAGEGIEAAVQRGEPHRRLGRGRP